MAKRKQVGDKLRFEVFKRDSFKCQYCGRSAPEVVLHVDHIKAVARGGGNEITNLITACSDCNLGKGARKLDDQSTVQKQRKQLEELQERRGQLEMMAKWKEGLDNLDMQKVEMICRHIEKQGGFIVDPSEYRGVLKAIKKYGFELFLEAVDITIEHCENDNIWLNYANAVCKNKAIEKQKPYWGQVLYIRGILFNRLRVAKNNETLISLDHWISEEGMDINTMQEMALTCNSIADFNDFLVSYDSTNKEDE